MAKECHKNGDSASEFCLAGAARAEISGAESQAAVGRRGFQPGVGITQKASPAKRHGNRAQASRKRGGAGACFSCFRTGWRCRFLRLRGDRPVYCMISSAMTTVSPLWRGSTLRMPLPSLPLLGFPARAGMNRDRPGWKSAGSIPCRPGKVCHRSGWKRRRHEPLPDRGHRGPGGGVRILNQAPPALFRESVRLAEQNLYSRARDLVGDRKPR
jgi:hypothetical protein